jgi:hypothetical protein
MFYLKRQEAKKGSKLMEQKVSIIIPVIRQEGAKRCIQAIKQNAGVPDEQFEILTAFDLDKVGCPGMVKKLTDMANFNTVMFLGDDTIPEKDFLKHAIDAMETLPDGWGVVGLNTQDIRDLKNGNPIAHWMAHKKMLDHIPGGYFFSTEYKHCWCDNELKDIAEEMGRWVRAKKSRVLHNHPINATADDDEGYQFAYKEDKQIHDFKTYCNRKRDRMQEKYGVKLAIAVPLTDDKVYTQFFFTFIKVITEYQSSLIRSGKPVSFDVVMPDFPGQIDEIRNNLVHQALILGCTHILMMDTDQLYNTDNMIHKMLAHNKKVLGARVHRRYPPFDPLLLEGDIGNLRQISDDKIKDQDGNFNQELQVDYTGTGCILYDMRIFNNMLPAKPFRLSVGDHGQPIGEDIGFCKKLKDLKIPIFVDCSIDIKHLTLLAVDFGTYKLFTKIIGDKKNV